MSQDLLDNLSTYNEQLKQVEAALTNSPSDPELLKLKEDLLEVLQLTKDLISSQTPSLTVTNDVVADNSECEWQPGDKCLAPWSKDLQLYAATVEEITSDGQVMVVFDEYGASEVTKLELLRPAATLETGESSCGPQSDSSSKTNKKIHRNNQEYLKKKKQKKMQRFKDIEESREQEKNKWQQFSVKAKKGRGLRGVVKSSIFKTPDAVNGKVGVGTCGVGGKPMTSFAAADKWKRGV